MDAEVVRRAMREAHGEDSYRRFVVELLGPCQALGRLRWWQEGMLEPVRVALDFQAPSFAQLTAMFRHCPVHGSELQADMVRVVHGTFKPVPRDELETAGRFFSRNSECDGGQPGAEVREGLVTGWVADNENARLQ